MLNVLHPARHVALAGGLLCLVLLVAPLCGYAGNHPLGRMESRASLEGADLVLNGVGIRNFLFFDLYQVALYLPRKLSDPRAVLNHQLPRRLRIVLLRDISAERDVELLMGGLEDNNTAEELAAIAVPLEQFLSILRELGNVPKGSVVQLDYLPGVGTRVWLNQRLLGAVPGAAFNRSLLKIWLGERPIQKDLKRALLGDLPESI